MFHVAYFDKHLLANNRQRIKELNKDEDYNCGIFIWASFLLYIPRKKPSIGYSSIKSEVIMPKITQDALTTSATPRRRSARQTKMPPSYNPSDDSDEEYDGPSAGKTKDKARSQRKRKHEKDEEEPSVAAKKTREETFQSGDRCPLCNAY